MDWCDDEWRKDTICFIGNRNGCQNRRKRRCITQTFHDEIATELEKKQQELNDRLKLLTSDNKTFQVTASYLLDLAQRAEELFKESDDGLRQKLLEYLLSNIELKDKKAVLYTKRPL